MHLCKSSSFGIRSSSYKTLQKRMWPVLHKLTWVWCLKKQTNKQTNKQKTQHWYGLDKEKPIPWPGNSQSGEITKLWIFSLSEQGIWTLHQALEFPKHLTLKNQWGISLGKLQNCREEKNPLLKSSWAGTHNPKTSSEACDWKMHGT